MFAQLNEQMQALALQLGQVATQQREGREELRQLREQQQHDQQAVARVADQLLNVQLQVAAGTPLNASVNEAQSAAGGNGQALAASSSSVQDTT